MDLLAILTGASPWLWVAFAFALFVVEMLTFTYFVIWIALAALATGLILALVPTMSGSGQLVWFALLSLGMTIAGRFYLARKRALRGPSTLNQRSERVIGRTGKALATFENGEGVVLIDQVRWAARLTKGSAEAGQPLKVVGAEGIFLYVTTE